MDLDFLDLILLDITLELLVCHGPGILVVLCQEIHQEQNAQKHQEKAVSPCSVSVIVSQSMSSFQLQVLFTGFFLFEIPDIRKIAVSLVIVHAPADDKFIFHFEALVVDLEMDLGVAAGRLVQQGAGADRGSPACAEELIEEAQRPARIDDIFHHKDIAPLERFIQVLDQADDTAG